MTNEKEMKLMSISYPSFSLNDATKMAEKSNQTLQYRFEKKDKDTLLVGIRVLVNASKDFPKDISATVEGIFVCEDYESDSDSLYMMKNNTLAILYPYLRSLLSNIATLAGMKPIVLPVINTFKAFGDLSNK